MKKYFLSFVILLLIFLSGCDADSPLGILFDPPECEVTSLQKLDAQPGQFAKFIITVENTGTGATAYNVGCTVRLKQGNTFIESSGTYFGDLKERESSMSEVWFTSIDNHNQYSSAEVTLYWYDAEDGYYEN